MQLNLESAVVAASASGISLEEYWKKHYPHQSLPPIENEDPSTIKPEPEEIMWREVLAA